MEINIECVCVCVWCSSMDRIQQLRREYQQARRDGAAPAYEELEARRQVSEYDPHRVSRLYLTSKR